MNIALLHYAYTPTIGGVEFVMEQHVALFARHGCAVRVITGTGATELPGVSVSEIPELLPNHPDTLAAQAEIADRDEAEAPAFLALKARFKDRFRDEIGPCDIVFVHNVMTMHFNLAATAALAELAVEMTEVRFVNWIHDLAAINPDYRFPSLERAPWRLITEALPGFDNVIISSKRQRQFCELVHIKPRQCPVVANGIEVLKVLKLSTRVHAFVRRYGIASLDIVLIHPTRILRRKNVECGIRVLAALRKAGKRCAYLVTGAPDPHNEAAREYGEELKALVAELGVERDFHFVSESFKVSDNDLHSLYLISDLLFLPSRQEGFGLPLLEAGTFRIPVFCPALEPMKSILQHNVNLFDLDDDPANLAARIIEALGESPGYQARKEVMQKYSWERLFIEKIEPMFLRPVTGRKVSSPPGQG